MTCYPILVRCKGIVKHLGLTQLAQAIAKRYCKQFATDRKLIVRSLKSELQTQFEEITVKIVDVD